MAPKIHRGATLTPHFRDFLPEWVSRQPWYQGTGTPQLRPVGYYRFEDQNGEVGIETHLLSDGASLYQLPLTYRGAPAPGQEAALISTTEHSVLGTRWIYDATADPAWVAELLWLVNRDGVAGLSMKSEVGPMHVHGRRLAEAELTEDDVEFIEVRRIVLAGSEAADVGESPVVGQLLGTWHPEGPGGTAASGVLVVLHGSGAAR